MSHILLLHDTREKDLARDFKDLFEEFNIGPIVMIAVSPDMGLTLEGKEKKYFDEAAGAVFVITPGSERLGTLYPSPSVSHEMGQAKRKFEKRPESIIYLVDNKCNLPAIDQKACIIFDRGDARSVINALTLLVRNLKAAALFRTAPIPTDVGKQPKITMDEFCSRLSERMKQVLLDVSNLPNGYIGDAELTKLLTQKYQLSMQDINFLERDLQTRNLVTHSVTTQPYFNGWFLSNLGWDVVRFEVEKKQRGAAALIMGLLSGKGSPSSVLPQLTGGLLGKSPQQLSGLKLPESSP